MTASLGAWDLGGRCNGRANVQWKAHDLRQVQDHSGLGGLGAWYLWVCDT